MRWTAVTDAEIQRSLKIGPVMCAVLFTKAVLRCRLNFLHGSVITQAALDIVDRAGVTRISCPSGRSYHQVSAHKTQRLCTKLMSEPLLQ